MRSLILNCRPTVNIVKIQYKSVVNHSQSDAAYNRRSLTSKLQADIRANFYRATGMHSAHYAVTRCPSVYHTPVLCLKS